MSTAHDHDPPGPGPELTEVERALRSLAPAPVRLDRDRIMHRAGLASARSARRPWLAAACLGLVALGEGAMLARRPPERIVERLVVVREPAAPAVEVEARTPAPRPPEGIGPGARDRLAWQVLHLGLDALPAAPRSAKGPSVPSRRSLALALESGDPS